MYSYRVTIEKDLRETFLSISKVCRFASQYLKLFPI